MNRRNQTKQINNPLDCRVCPGCTSLTARKQIPSASSPMCTLWTAHSLEASSLENHHLLAQGSMCSVSCHHSAQLQPCRQCSMYALENSWVWMIQTARCHSLHLEILFQRPGGCLSLFKHRDVLQKKT